MTLQIDSYSIEDILPHRGDMLLIDDILEVDSKHAITASVIKKSCPLMDADGVQALIMVELAAQSAGVCNGLDRIKKQGIDSEKMGWLVGIKRAVFHVEKIPVGSKVITHSKNVHNYDKLREVSAVVYLDEKLIGEIILQLYQV